MKALLSLNLLNYLFKGSSHCKVNSSFRLKSGHSLLTIKFGRRFVKR
ncbi:hypothetical protein [Clostridium beijerinckii]|nr:hypothetical protein [Clostridium beijerinckii]